MGHTKTVPLSTYARHTADCDMDFVHSRWANWDGSKGSTSGSNYAYMIIVFVVVVIIIWAILVATCPDFIKKSDKHGHKTKECDNGRALIAAIVISIIICVVLAFLARGAGY